MNEPELELELEQQQLRSRSDPAGRVGRKVHSRTCQVNEMEVSTVWKDKKRQGTRGYWLILTDRLTARTAETAEISAFWLQLAGWLVLVHRKMPSCE